MTVKLLERREYGTSFLKDLSMGTTENVGKAIRKGMVPLDVKAVGDSTIQFIISNGSLDRENDTINVNGWNLENYLKNPVILWAHEHHSPPVGKGPNIRVENDNLISVAEFVGQDIMPFAHMIYQLYVGGFMNAVSVGFMPDERVWSEEQGGIKFLTQEMLEYSTVPVPANPEALQLAAKGGIDVAPMKSWAEQLLDEWQEGNRPVGASRKSIERMLKIADDKKTETSIPAKEIDQDRVKEIRQRNIWEPRLKEYRETNLWNVTDWGEKSREDQTKRPSDVPAYLWEAHLEVVAGEKAAEELLVKDANDAIGEWIKNYGEPSEAIKVIGGMFTGSDELDMLDLVKTIGTDGVDKLTQVLTLTKDNPYLTDEYKMKLEALEKIAPEDIEAVRELLDSKGFSQMDDASIKDMILELEDETEEFQKGYEQILSLESQVRELKGYLELRTQERDAAMMVVEEFAASEKESVQRVDPAKIVRLFGDTLAKSIRGITGRLPNDT